MQIGVGTIAVVAGVLALAGCGDDGSDDANAPSPQATTTSTATQRATAPPAAATTSSTPEVTINEKSIESMDDVQALVAPMGLECSNEDQFLMCTRGDENWQFRISPQGDGDAAFRKAACDAGASDGGTVITNGGSLVIYSGNDGQNEAAFLAELEDAGFSGLETEEYC